VLGQYRGFFWAQLRRSVFFVRGFCRVNFGLVVLDQRLRLVRSLLRRRGRRGCFHVRLDGSVARHGGRAILPFRKRLAGQRFDAGRKRSRGFGARLRVKFAARFKCARRGGFVRLFGLVFDDGSCSRRARREIRGLVRSGGPRRIVG
jgi:hypothetical protein